MRKSKILLLLTVTIIFMISGCGSSSDQQGEESTSTSVPDDAKGFIITSRTVDRANQNDVRDYIDNVIPQRNSRISHATAAIKLSTMKYWADKISTSNGGNRIDWNDAMYGFLMNFDSLHLYLDSLKKTNQNLPEEKRIDGIRVYYGAVDYKSGYIPEVFLFPTINGKNIYPIDDHYDSLINAMGILEKDFLDSLNALPNFVGDGSGYNATMPCPQACP